MATINDLRKHVLDDAVELMETLGIVTPLATSAAIVAPAQLLLRRLLTGHVVLVLTRLHAKPKSMASRRAATRFKKIWSRTA
jgi:hypothetical protein